MSRRPILAQEADADAEGGGGFLDRMDDETVLDEWEFPVGEWVEQGVDWAVVNLRGVLRVVEWPFDKLFEIVVDEGLLKAPWLLVVLGFFVVGAALRGVKVGALAGISLFICGLLGTAYWADTMRTIGMILVAVFLCALIGIPVGIACGRFDGVWSAIRPVLDAMQVIHTFVYMLPVIFFYGLGAVPATMVTMIFAVPPLVRLTNLGIRQVPEDVVEASRSFGAPELRVLTDVQLPLARPAIMTGLNQTLLLAISMGGIAAIMGAGGLGLKVFRAVQNIDVALAGSAGLAFFLVAVVLDRISQPGGAAGPNLLSRIRMAWANRETPEDLIGEPGFTPPVAPSINAEKYTSVEAAERLPMVVAGAAGLVAAISALLVWGSDAGLVTAYSRGSDVDLAGQSFSGLAASGGSFFGVLTAVGGLFVVACVAQAFMGPGRGPAWFSSAGATLASGLVVGSSLAYLSIDASPEVTAFSFGPGPYLGLGAGVLALAASWRWMWKTPIAEITPQSGGISSGRMAGGAIALLLVTISLYSGWTFDNRVRTVFTPELQAEMDEIERQVEDGELAANIGAQQMQNLNNKAVKNTELVLDGRSDDGSRLGWPALALALAGLAMLVPAAGFVRPRLTNAASRFMTAEAGSGRGVFAFLGVTLAVASILWIYAVDTVLGKAESAAGNIVNVEGRLGPVFLGSAAIEVLLLLAILVGAVIMLSRASGVRAEATMALLIGFGGFALLLAVMMWQYGPTPVLAILAVIAGLIGLGFVFGDLSGEQQWAWSGIAAAAGLALMGLAGGWVLSIMRATDDKFYSGIGAALALTAGFILLASSRGVLMDFGRAKIYGDLGGTTSSHVDEIDVIDAPTAEPELVGR